MRRQSCRATDDMWQPEVPMLPRSRETSRALLSTLLEGKGQERLTLPFLRRGSSLPRMDRQPAQAHCNHRQDVRYLSASEGLHVTCKGRRKKTARTKQEGPQTPKTTTKHALNPRLLAPSVDIPEFGPTFFDSQTAICLQNRDLEAIAK